MPPVITKSKAKPKRTTPVRGVASPNSALKLGESRKAEPKRNCLLCSKFTGCKDDKKSHRYLCSRFIERPVLDMQVSISDLMKQQFGIGSGNKTRDDIRKDTAVKSKIIKPSKRQLELFGKPSSDMDEETAKEFSIMTMIESALASELPIPPDFELNDESCRAAPNVFEWIRGADYAKISQPLFGKQIQILLNCMGEWCPRCSNPGYTEDIPLDATYEDIEENIVFLRYGKCPECKARKSELVKNGELNEYYTLAGVAGQRGGKSAVASAGETYNIHRWVKLPNPQAMFSVLDAQALSGTYVALTHDQAKINIYNAILATVQSSPWFQKYHKLLSEYSDKRGMTNDIYTLGDEFIRYRHRKLQFAVSSGIFRTLRGKTRITGIVDEAGMWKVGKEYEGKDRASGDEMYGSMFNSMATIIAAHENLLKKGYDFLPKPFLSAISSPMDIADLIMRLYRDAEGSTHSYAFKASTWEMNPTMPYDCSYLTMKRKQNPEGFMRDFGAEPPLSSAGWITDTGNVAPLFHLKRKNGIKLRQIKMRTRNGQPRTGAEVENCEEFNGGRIMGLDAGRSNNSFGLCIGHVNEDGKVIIDAMAEIQPRHKSPIAFDFIMKNVLIPLCQDMGVNVVLADRWNSNLMLDQLEADVGVQVLTHSLKYEHLDDFRNAIYDRKIEFPALEIKDEEAIFEKKEEYPAKFMGKPVSHFFYQCMTVQDFPAKKKVEKGSGSTDDIMRAAGLVHWGLHQEALLEMLDGNNDNSDAGFSNAIGLLMGGRPQGANGISTSASTLLGASISRAGFGSGDSASSRSVVRSENGGGVPGSGAVGMLMGGR